MENYNLKHNFRAWLPIEKIEAAAREQIENLSQIPSIHRWIAIMPDVHPGFGMPIGGVVPLVEHIIPNAVGVDIGCGVIALKTNLSTEEIKVDVSTILQQFLRDIPVGFKKRNKGLNSHLWTDVPDIPVLQRETKNARLQLGTLGGGNHFIEIQRDPQNNVWLMLHSGSRNLGKQVADYYNKAAQKHCKANGIDFPAALAWLPMNTTQGQEYYQAMDFCVRFAAENRRLMAEVCVNILARKFPGIDIVEQIETIHNYASKETHYHQGTIVHRKGAVRARGKVVIPGSMGTASYIGQGLENPLSFHSCSHGAGRVLGRKEAKRILDKKQILDGLKEKEIILVSPDSSAAVEEASAAYKDIEEVMEYQKDLVKPLVRLEPMGVLKG